MLFFPKIALFYINCYFIGKVSPIYGFLAGFSSPESIFAEKKTYFLFCNQNRKYVIFPKIALFHINCYFIGKVSKMYGFLAGFSSPESIFAEKKTYFLFCNQNRKYVIFPKIALFHINCYFIGKVSPMYGFLAGFSSPESIFAEKNTYFLFCNQNRKYVIFPKIALFHINCYFIGKVSKIYGFLAGFSSPESIFAEKNTYFLFCNHNRKYVIFSQKQVILYFFPKSHYFTSIVTS